MMFENLPFFFPFSHKELIGWAIIIRFSLHHCNEAMSQRPFFLLLKRTPGMLWKNSHILYGATNLKKILPNINKETDAYF
jgi:hypothetical protein